MAMSKQEYVTIGEQQFARGEARPLGNSWQSKAMQFGYDEAACKDHDARVEAGQDEAQMHSEAQNQGKKADESEALGVGSPSAADALAHGLAGLGYRPVVSTVSEQLEKLRIIEKAESLTALGQLVLKKMISENEVLADIAGANTDTLFGVDLAKSGTDKTVIHNYQPSNCPQSEHITFLQREAYKTTNVNRANRLMAKAMKLSEKWNRREYIKGNHV